LLYGELINNWRDYAHFKYNIRDFVISNVGSFFNSVYTEKTARKCI
jgi:hypothetical protein